MLHQWTKHTEGNGSTGVRVFLFDSRKANDLIDHTILPTKLANLGLPHGIDRLVVEVKVIMPII